jgi:TRAP-type C4-dicarboxylate transport system permease small subunit
MTEHTDRPSPGLSFGEKPPLVPTGIEGAVVALLMLVLTAITFGNVLVRYFTDRSFAFTEEYSVALMVLLTLVGAASAFATDRHIRMTFFVEKLGRRTQRRIEFLVLALSLLLFSLITWYGAWLTWDEYRFEVLSPGLGVPQWIYTLALPVFAAVISLRLLGRLMRVARAPSG